MKGIPQRKQAYGKATPSLLSKLDETRKSALGFLSELTDDKSFVETGAFTSGTTFEDGVEALGEGIITGYATVFGIPVYLFVQNFEAMRGSFSSAQATKIKNVMDAAVKNGVPFVSVIDSAGARLDEGAKVLEGYAKIIRLAASMKNEVPHVAVIRGAATGLMDVFANVADVVIFGTDGYASLAAPSAVLAKDGKNPSDAKKYLGKDAAEKSGVAALEYADVATLKNQIASVLTFLSGESKIADNPNKVAKKVESVSDAVGAICDNGSALEISCDEAATKTYFAYADGAPVGVLSVEGELTCKDFRKIKRFVNLLDAYNIPLVSVVEIWKRFRKWGGIPTGITQNVKDLLASREVENIFENSDFVYLLNQASGDRKILSEALNISPSQQNYITNSNASHCFNNDTDFRIIDNYLIIMNDRILHRVSRKIAKIKDILYFDFLACSLCNLFFVNS